ncbi:MAG: PAS domain-containing sensor histidine kinase, partial [Roseibium sp.]|nr:PAS domain-containing sensor histidine kinase [Roseibium sp.]
MDNQTQSFLELSAKNDLVQLVADKRAAWLWSADGARILWANAAGASFFSAQTIADLGALDSLERSPARPHIARIATSGLTDRFSIDRLRFYRGLRVMLLTCQCKRVELESGETAALIVCSDKGLALTKEPIPAFAQLAKSPDTSVFVMTGGRVDQSFGNLSGTPEDLDLPESQRALFGPLDLNGSFHEGIILQIPAGPKLVLLDDEALPDDAQSDEAQSDDTQSDDATSAPEGEGATLEQAQLATVEASAFKEDDRPLALNEEGQSPEPDTGEMAEASEDFGDGLEGEDEFETRTDTVIEPDLAEKETGTDESETVDTVSVSDVHEAVGERHSEEIALEADDPEEKASETAETSEIEPEPSADAEEAPQDGAEQETFAFQPRRRPVRFAWKMDADQRFTFLSDEFAEVLGPEATDITGLTWETVSSAFDLDPRGNISRALDRRDTWSGKTVNWPVSGAELRVPVDMAALPAFDRNRKFEGYRGFGVCRTADALHDPNNPIATLQVAILDAPAAEEPETDVGPLDTLPASNPEISEDLSADESLVDADLDMPASEAEADDLSLEEKPAETEPDENDMALGAVEIADTVDEVVAPEVETEIAPQPAPQKLEDLKPAQPNSFAGKTFLGASAAALVGSLAKITGKSEPEFPENPTPSAENANLARDLQSAAAALDDPSADKGTTPSEADTERSSSEELPVVEAANRDADDLLLEEDEPQAARLEEATDALP